MRIFWLFCALGALFGCRTVSEPSGTAIALFCSTSEQSKTDILTVGEEVAVFADPEGTEDYFLEAAQFIVGSDGRSLTYGSTVYYPDPKQAVRFWAYFPYHKGTFSVPTDQSTAKALKQADLCGAVASTTPVATPVALEFRHLMARVVITTNEPTTKVVFPNAVASGVLHAATAEFILTDTRSEVWTTGNELIVPVQPLSRLVLTVADTVLGVVSKVEYVFDGSVSLEAGKTTTLDLTLHPDTKTATLSGSSITDWELVKTEGTPSHAVSNVLTLHWPNYLLQGAPPDRIIFTIGGTDYTVASGITYANHTFTVSFASQTLRYPYTISKIRFYQSNHLVQSCSQLLGSTIYKAGNSTIGINPNAIKVGDLWWATGNLVASNATAGARGEGGCRIGEPADGGLYFQFGSLIGWKGGALANGGTGVGSNPYTGGGIQWWGGATAWSWANDAMVWPTGMVDNPTSWPQGATTNQWYFGLQTDWSTAEQNIRDFPNLATGGLANIGVGDPCSYYLGGTWRLPTAMEYTTICNDKKGYGIDFAWSDCNASWTDTPVIGGNFSDSTLFFPFSGYREGSMGKIQSLSTAGFGWSCSVYTTILGFYGAFNSRQVYPQYGGYRANAFPVRCVSE